MSDLAGLRVATYNLYLGADLSLVFAVRDAAELAERTAALAEQLTTTDFAVRARAVAALLARERPELVGLQEVACWSRTTAGERRVWRDFLPLLLDRLGAAGVEYDAYAVTENFQGGGALSTEESMDVTGANAVLVRRGSSVEVIAEQCGAYSRLLHLPTPVPGLAFDVARSWGWVDVTVAGTPLRFVNTHTEAYAADVRAAQRDELLAAIGDPGAPVVLVGDLNATPDEVGMPADFVDAWSAVGEQPESGFTCGQGADLTNLSSTLNQRIDYVFVRGAAVEACRVVGNRPEDRAGEPALWPSDHAGVVADLLLPAPRRRTPAHPPKPI